MPRWEVDSKTPRLRMDNETGEIIKCSNYAEYKEKYLQTTSNSDMLYSIGKDGKVIDAASIQNTSKVKIPGLNKAQNDKIYSQRKALLEQLKSQPVGIEGSVIVPLKNNDVFDVVIGKMGNTSIRDYDGLYYAIHNHPNSDVLSPGDIIGFLKRSNMYGIEAIGNDGKTVYAITKTINSDIVGYSEYVSQNITKFKKEYPDLDVYNEYELIEKFSIQLLQKGVEYGFNIIK